MNRANLRIQTTASGKESAFPAHNLFVRNSDPTILRSVYLSNDIVKAVLTANEPSRLRIISAGLKIATKQEGSGRALAKLKQKQADGDGAVVTSEDAEVFQKYRVLNDAVALILPYMKPEHIIHGDMGVLKVFVRRTYPLAKEFEEPYKGTFEACEFGHQVLRIDPLAGSDAGPESTMYVNMVALPRTYNQLSVGSHTRSYFLFGNRTYR